jgi:hypothetical protein
MSGVPEYVQSDSNDGTVKAAADLDQFPHHFLQ